MTTWTAFVTKQAGPVRVVVAWCWFGVLPVSPSAIVRLDTRS